MEAVLGVTGRKSANPPVTTAPDSGDNPQWAGEKPPRRVLVVDDEALIRWSVSETLTAMGMEVNQASDAASTVQCLSESGPFEVVVLDYRLPDNDDLSLLARVRALSPDSAVVLMTAFGAADVADSALQLGASTIVVKPFELREIARIVETLATHKHP